MNTTLVLGLGAIAAAIAIMLSGSGFQITLPDRKLRAFLAAPSSVVVTGAKARPRWIIPAIATIVAFAVTRKPAIAVIVGVGALFLPKLRAIRAERRRLRDFEHALPDALDLLASSLEAGAPLLQAMELVSAESDGPLSEEFSRILADNRLGTSLIDAMATSSERIGSRDFDWCVKAVRAQQEFGASLAGVLRTLAEFMRWRDELRGEVRALTAEGRLSAYVLIGLPFMVAAFFLLVNPAYFGPLISSSAGFILIAVAGGLMAVGSVWMTRVVKVEV